VQVAAGNVTIPPNHSVPKVGSVVEVRYLYAFKESGVIYQPIYLGQRSDIEPSACQVSQLKWKAEMPPC
jgi:bifunctional non-homologous end joining protein LigD